MNFNLKQFSLTFFEFARMFVSKMTSTKDHDLFLFQELPVSYLFAGVLVLLLKK